MCDGRGRNFSTIAPHSYRRSAALLLFGKTAAIERHVPFFETVVVTDQQPITIRKNVIESVRDLCIGESSILRSRLPQIPAKVLKDWSSTPISTGATGRLPPSS
jgi:hypothetical protein